MVDGAAPDPSELRECDCIAKVDAVLAEGGHNTRVERLIRLFPTMGESHALVRACKADPAKRGKLVTIEAFYCPFCGVRYPKEAADGDQG